MKLEASNLNYSYGSRLVLDDVSVSLTPGLTAIIGPNAAGKSTLLKCLAGLLRTSGAIRLENNNLQELDSAQRTSLVSFLPQQFSSKAAVSVFEAVLLGKLKTLGLRVREEDIEAVDVILKQLLLDELASRQLGELSGGQAQLVAIAQALVREPKIMLMDEPTSSLDLRKQFEVCELVRRITKEKDMTTAVVLHDLNLAARYADRICVIHLGRMHSMGTPVEVLTCEMIEAVYRVRVRIDVDAASRPAITVLGTTEQPLETTD